MRVRLPDNCESASQLYPTVLGRDVAVTQAGVVVTDEQAAAVRKFEFGRKTAHEERTTALRDTLKLTMPEGVKDRESMIEQVVTQRLGEYAPLLILEE